MVVIGVVVNEWLISAILKLPGLPVIQSDLNNRLEEAEWRIIYHVHRAIGRSCNTVVVLSNGTDTIILHLHYTGLFK